LYGEDKNTTIIDGGEELFTIIISANTVVMKGFSITGEGRIDIEGRNNLVTENNINTYFTCIRIKNNGNTISNNSINSLEAGIDIYFADSNMISGNLINSHIAGGIVVYGDNNIIRDNIVMNTEGLDFLCGDIHLTHANSNIIENNTLIGLDDRLRTGIMLTLLSTDNQVMNNSISGYEYEGIYLREVNDNKITHNTIYNCFTGIFLTESNSNSINLNSFQTNKDSIFLSNSRFNEIYQNNFIDNSRNARFRLLSFQNTWNENYWERPRILPYPIIGSIGFFIPSWINVDWNPATEPYHL